MKIKHLLVILVMAALYVGSIMVFAQGDTKPASAQPDPRIDKLLQQNEQILKNQEDIKKQLESLKQDILQLRRRAS
jgi:hypothetical protein